jgi:DNA-directed RNA polymerase specialized sigma subunit
MFNKKIEKQIVSTFNKETKDAKKIAKKLGVSRKDVMNFLMESGLRTYSVGTLN